jgi:hypothetical protein
VIPSGSPPRYITRVSSSRFELKIIGSDAKTTIIDAGGLQAQAAVVGSEPRVQVTLAGLTLRNANVQADGGGGIYNCFGTLTVIDSIITGNRVEAGLASFLMAAVFITAL